MRNILKIIFISIRSILLFIVVSAVLTAATKNVQTTILVENFKSKGVYQEDISTSTVKYYKILSDEENPTYLIDGKTIIPGNSCDILTTKQAELGGPLTRGFIQFFAGGHAALCSEEYTDFETKLNDFTSIEATGLNDGDDNSASVFYRDYWADDYTYTEIIGLRVKMNDREKKEVLANASAYLGEDYNYSFLFNTSTKTYCSDLISKAYSTIGVNLNKDGFTTSVYDLIVSNETYISYYHYFKDGIKYIYYLG